MKKKAKKVHWTQTPEGRNRVSVWSKKYHKQKRTAANAKEKEISDYPLVEATTGALDTHIAYACGYIECWLYGFARQAGISYPAIAQEVGKVLRNG